MLLPCSFVSFIASETNKMALKSLYNATLFENMRAYDYAWKSQGFSIPHSRVVFSNLI